MQAVEVVYPNNPLVRHSVEFSLEIMRFCQELEKERCFVVSKQLIRSGTAIGALILEAQSAESRGDFIHKLKVADKEARETWYWLYLCKNSASYPFNEILVSKLSEIQRILGAILKHGKNQ
jgi:four helix bundle protein